MKNIDDLVSKINNNVSIIEEKKESLNKEKETIKKDIEELKETSYTLEAAIELVKRKKRRIGIIVFIVIATIYGVLVYNNQILNNEVLYVLGLILALDLIIQLTNILNKHVGDNIAKNYNYVDFYSLYQQYNIIKRDIKVKNNKMVEIELSLDKEDKEIEKLEEIATSVDTLLHEDTTYSSQTISTRKHTKTNNAIYDNLL